MMFLIWCVLAPCVLVWCVLARCVLVWCVLVWCVLAWCVLVWCVLVCSSEEYDDARLALLRQFETVMSQATIKCSVSGIVNDTDDVDTR